MGPAVGTVVGDEHGQVTEDGDAIFFGIRSELVPLTVEDVLHEFDVGYGTGQFFSISFEASGS